MTRTNQSIPQLGNCTNNNKFEFLLHKARLERGVFTMESRDLGERLESTDPQIKVEAEREAMLNRRVSRKHMEILVKNPEATKQRESTYIAPGQYFTSFSKLSELWNCTETQVKNQLGKWEKEEKVSVEELKDSEGLDIGLRLTYHESFFGDRGDE